RTLAAVGGVEIGGVQMAAVGRLDEGRPPAARVLARTFALDFDDVGAEVGENLPRPGACQDPAKLEQAESGQRPGHQASHISLWARGARDGCKTGASVACPAPPCP